MRSLNKGKTDDNSEMQEKGEKKTGERKSKVSVPILNWPSSIENKKVVIWKSIDEDAGDCFLYTFFS